VIVHLHAAALNHRDVWIRTGRYAGITLPLILGSDGAGEVVATGADVDPSWRGRHVVIDPAFDWGNDERAQGPSFNILGLPRDGTYAELVKVPVEHLYDKPRHLSWEEAAAVPLASVTAYRALVRRAQVKPGETVVVTGIGGGVATCALLIGAHLGATIFVTSGTDAKLDAARTHGAAGGVNHLDPEWPKAMLALIGNRPDVVVDGAGADTFNKALDLVRPGGRVVSYGATLGPAKNLEVRRIFWKQLNVLGSTMGTARDFRDMLQLYADGLRPVVDSVLPLDDAADAHRRMEEGRQFGKIVLRI
jgi:zinc-binding alcohol dehydrogenase/oxidoreductase